MRHRSRLRRLEAGVRWLETEGVIRRAELRLKLARMMQEMADYLATNPAIAKKHPSLPDGLPRPSPHLRPRLPAPVVVAEKPRDDTPGAAADAPPRARNSEASRGVRLHRIEQVGARRIPRDAA